MVYSGKIDFGSLPEIIPLNDDELVLLENEVYTSILNRGVTSLVEKTINERKSFYMLKWCPEWIKLIELQQGKETLSVDL